MSITPIKKALPGERVVALSPENAAEAAIVWLARPNVFAGRALTAPTLQRRQRWQAGRLALRGQALTAGVVHGLEVGHEILPPEEPEGPSRVQLSIAAGLGLAVSGEDVTLTRPVEIDLAGLPVFAEPSVEADPPDEEDEPPAPEDTDDDFDDDPQPPLRARAILDRNLGDLFTAEPIAISRVGILVLQPIVVDRLGELDPTDPCELSACGETDDNSAFEDWRIADGVRVVWYAWPEEWRSLPPEGPAQRNELAWTIFQAEAALPPGGLLPWESLGVPVALVGLSETLEPAFIDRASVVRLGGRSRHPRLAIGASHLSANWRRPLLWQAQIEQLAEQIAAAGDPPPDAATLAQSFTRLPPAGLLPTNAIDLSVLPLNQSTERLESTFFPGGFQLDAAPVPLESLDLAIREAAPLAPIDMGQTERVRVLVPVPQAVYEPRLLHEEVIDPEFQATLDRFLLARAGALGARQGLRAKISELIRLATGRAVPVPALDADTAALEPESLEPWGPPPAGGGHRSTLAAGMHQHVFTDTPNTLIAGESLYAWVYLNPDNPPRMLMLQWRVGDDSEHRAYWAASGDEELIPLGTDGTASRLRIGDLPQAGQWVRLEVLPGDVGLSEVAIDGMAFTLFDGQAAFGPVGRFIEGSEQPWFSSILPSGATVVTEGDGIEPWTFLTPNDLNAPFEPAFGFEVEPQTNTSLGQSPELTELLADPALAQLVVGDNGTVTTGVLSSTERNQLGVRGLEGFIALLKARADRADDLIDYGFVKVQTDTYRMRQLILGTTAATRLAVSPALATIAQSETAVASQERISGFFDELKANVAPFSTTPDSGSSAAPRSANTGTSTSPTGTISGVSTMRSGATLLTSVTGTSSLTVGSGSSLSFGGSGGSLSFGGSGNPLLIGGSSDPIVFGGGSGSSPFLDPIKELPGLTLQEPSRNTAIDFALNETKLVAAATKTYTPKDVVGVDPLIGKATIRTTSIAQRLEQPKALEAKDYSTATRHDALRSLLQFADELRTEDGNVTPGLFAGINVHGLANDPFLQTDEERTRRFVPLTTFITSRSRLSALLQVPDREGDESAYFSDSADLADNTIALMRQVEGRVKLYRDAIRACERVLESLRGHIKGVEKALVAWDERLAEARHDVAVTRALIAEENDRLAAINTRRASVLRDEVRFLAYIRPRETHNLAATPIRTLDPGLLEAPVPACLESHTDAPDDLTTMLAVLREAPVSWFVSVPKLIERLDRTDFLVKTVQSAQLRSQVFALKSAAPAIVATAAPLRAAIGFVQTRQQQIIRDTRLLASSVNVAQLASLSWQGAKAQVEKVISLGDLIDGEHGRGEVARRAAEVFDQMSRITACLHAEFSAVLPAIRLEWAERLSQFDQAPSLRDLSVLVRWPEIPYIDRKQMQAYVDWLFDQIDARVANAEGLMNDVVRMCLLLAADAPIGRIIAGRLPRPVVARPGVRIPLTAFDPSRLRVGMHALVYKGAEVVTRAVIEDIGSEISARVIQTQTAEVNLDVAARVQFAEVAQVTVTQRPMAKALVKSMLAF